jgi:hypothetical protein
LQQEQGWEDEKQAQLFERQRVLLEGLHLQHDWAF